MDRTGNFIRLDQLNSLVTEFRGNKYSGASKMNAVAARTSGESQINSMKKKKDWYRDYFNNLKKVFRLKQNAIDQCMDKVDKMLTARMNGIALTGQREAYAANIMKLVCTELNLPLRMKDISRVSNNPKP